MEKSTFDHVKAILVEHLGVDPERITEASTLSTDLGADSLDEVELVMALEEEFGLEIPDDVAEGLHDATVGQLVETVSKLLRG